MSDEKRVRTEYKGHTWGCHPETCACREWCVVRKDGSVVSRHAFQAEAEIVANEINK